ncbi:integrase [Kitasatospora sp. NPDC057015]|uniref:integrase n=1 Tax=Kitasatospora sp. NPDC057015 TaxID=3346001 RepID=UPI00363EF9D6
MSSPAVDMVAQHVLARMVDYFQDAGTPWPRRLWDVGSVLALEELWEACRWQARNVLSSTACDWQRNELSALIGPDRGLGEKDLRKEITELLKRSLVDPSPEHRRLRVIIEYAREGYLERLADAVKAGSVKPERLSRTVAAHLLDLGYSSSYLLAWARQTARSAPTTVDVVLAAAELAAQGRRDFEVLIALDKVPRRDLAEPLPNWRNKGAVVAWLRENGHDTTGFRAGGGFVYTVRAWDAYGAAGQARQLLERMTARAEFLRKDRGGVASLQSIWVAGHRTPVPLSPPARGADVLSLVHEGHLYKVEGHRTRIDDALELAAAVNRGALTPAVAGGWAAVESLLSHPDDPKGEERSGKAVAADRLAAILACSWPRAELTTLAHRHAPVQPDALSTAVAAADTNLRCCQLIVEALETGGAGALALTKNTKLSDSAAADRMAALIVDPTQQLQQVNKAFRIALRRLYRTRNIILHGGSIDGVALEASLRTAAPLIGAGLDRVVHAYYTEGLEPLDLAARAEVALRLVNGETGLSLVELLEPRRH